MLRRKISSKLCKRSCDIKMKLVPYGGGWTDVYFDICGDSHYFIISSVLGYQFSDFLRILYLLFIKTSPGRLNSLGTKKERKAIGRLSVFRIRPKNSR